LLFTTDNNQYQPLFCCSLAAGAAKKQGFRGDDETHGCFFTAFNSDISERCSILHTTEGWALDFDQMAEAEIEQLSGGGNQ
jgi:hypothetical protein